MAKITKVRFDFWLNVSNPDQGQLADTIQELKSQRKYHQVIRDGIRLVSALLAGDIQPLLDMFPWVYDAIAADVLAKSGSGGSGGTDEIKEQLNTLTNIVLQQGLTLPEANPRQKHQLNPPKNDDLPMLEIKQAARDASNNSTWNFLIASAVQVYGNYDSLPPAVIEYGLQTGRISPDALIKSDKKTDKKPVKKPVKKPAPELVVNEIKVIAGASAPFSAPDFEDLELNF